jgi:glucose-6-phosphate 1-dehydrogenase
MIIIFGATGDLTKRKLIPALYNLYSKNQLKNIPIVCIARKKITKDRFISTLNINQFIPKKNNKILKGFLKKLHYFSFNLEKDNDYKNLNNYLSKVKEIHRCSNNKIFYLALSPNLFKKSIDVIKSAKLLKGNNKVVFEKPFGNNLQSAKDLNKKISSVFKERNIYRIDHYLGKELVQNILVFRFANPIYEQIWNNKFIDNVQITVSEKIGVETRGNYYDKYGAIKDMVQNHLLQILALAAMESPQSLDAKHIRNEKVKILSELQKPKPSDIVTAQYESGTLDGKRVLAYKKELNIPRNSKTETFAAIKTFINNKRWKGTPFYLRTGKHLKSRFAEINLVLKDTSCKLFSKKELCDLPNVINFRIQPDEGIAIKFNAKYPGYQIKLHPVTMEFCHHCEFGINSPEAYETLIHEILKGDQTLFTRWDGVEASWKFVDNIIKTIKNKTPLPYKPGTYGPSQSDTLLKKDGKVWILPKEEKK